MKNKFITIYAIFAFSVVILSIIWFSFSLSKAVKTGSVEAEKTYSWLVKETSIASLDGFMSDMFIMRVNGVCLKSHTLRSVIITSPSGPLFTWPASTVLESSSLFMKTFSQGLDIGDNRSGSIVITAVISVLPPETIFYASGNVFLVLLALLFATLIVLIAIKPVSITIKKKDSVPDEEKSTVLLSIDNEPTLHEGSWSISEENEQDEQFIEDADDWHYHEEMPSDETVISSEIEPEMPVLTQSNPEGLFSPVTGLGWEQYLAERLDAELVRAASSEQDLSLIVIRVDGLNHTDLLSRKIADVLLETFRFRDMVFELSRNGFAGILQNMNLDSAMKTADSLYSDIDALIMNMEYEGQITIGITTRTARLIPAQRMIEEALTAAKKASEEPSLPIVAFRANPDKYRNFIAENA